MLPLLEWLRSPGASSMLAPAVQRYYRVLRVKRAGQTQGRETCGSERAATGKPPPHYAGRALPQANRGLKRRVHWSRVVSGSGRGKGGDTTAGPGPVRGISAWWAVVPLRRLYAGGDGNGSAGDAVLACCCALGRGMEAMCGANTNIGRLHALNARCGCAANGRQTRSRSRVPPLQSAAETGSRNEPFVRLGFKLRFNILLSRRSFLFGPELLRGN